MKTKEELNALNKDAKRLTDEEIKTVVGGMKAVVGEEKSWWRTIVDFIFKIKS